MSHTRVVDKSARIIDQCAKGRFIRNVATVDYIVANARSNDTAPNRIMADLIANDSSQKGLFVAPCNGTIESIMVNGSPYFTQQSGGLTMLQVYKQGQVVITGSGMLVGGCATSGVTPQALSSGVTYDATISGASFTAGQAIYAVLATSNDAVTSGPGYITVSVEWVPDDKSYAGS